MHVLAAVENIFFLILIAIVGLIRWAFAAAESAKNAEAEKSARPQTPNAPMQRAPAQTEEERIRRFMEALGVPTSNAPPRRRQVTPKIPRHTKRSVRPIDPFPRPRRSIWTPEPVLVPPQPVIISTPPPLPEPAPVSQAPVAKEQAPSVFEVHVIESGADPTALVRPKTPADTWAARLRNAEDLRNAIILREIFGPARSLQESSV